MSDDPRLVSDDEDPPLTEAELASLEQEPSLRAASPALASLVSDLQAADIRAADLQAAGVPRSAAGQAEADARWARLEAALGREDDHPFAANETSGIRTTGEAGAAERASALDGARKRRPRPVVAAAPGARSGRAMTWGAVVLAAAAAFALYAKKREAPAGPAASAKTYPPIVEVGDGGVTRTLALGEVIKVPLDKTRWIAANGRVRVRVGSESVVRVLENGERILLALDHGTLGADVTPVPGGEPLAIDVGRHRLAVHGTKFQVQRAEESVDVAVTEGVVVWGWPKGDRTQGVEIKAGQIANFVWDTGGVVNDGHSATTKVEAALRVEPATLPPLVPGTTPSTSSTALSLLAPLPHPGSPAPSPVPEAPKPVAPPPSTVEVPATASTSVPVPVPPAGLSDVQAGPGLTKLQKALESCVVAGPDGPKFTIETTMTVSVGKTGAVEAWTFDPPLDPTLRECARKKAAGFSFPSADNPSTLKRSVVLGKK